MLEVQFLEPGAKAPVVGHPGEDLGYDVFALEDVVLPYGVVTMVRTGIAVAAYASTERVMYTGINKEVIHKEVFKGRPLGLLIRDRSSMAAKGIVTSGGVIDAGYRGEIKVLMTNQNIRNQIYGDRLSSNAYQIKAGDKIAQMVPVPVLTGEVSVKSSLDEASTRGADGFGSTGQ